MKFIQFVSILFLTLTTFSCDTEDARTPLGITISAADFEKTMDMLRMIRDKGYSEVVDRAVVNELYISTDTGLSKQIEELDIENAETHTNWTRELPNGETLDAAERNKRLVESINFIKENFSGKIMVFSESKTAMEDNKK